MGYCRSVYGRMVAAAWLFPLLAGCLYIPPLGSVKPEQLGEIRVGSTTRQQAVELLGEPTLLKHDSFFVYDLYSSKGGIIGFIPGGYSGAVFWLPLDQTNSRVLLEFDGSGIVKRYDVVRGRPSGSISGPTSGIGGGVRAEAEAETALLKFVGGSQAKRIFKSVEVGWLKTQIKQFGSVAFSPDGRIVAAGDGGDSKQVRLWDAETGEQKMALKGAGSLFRGLHWGVAPIKFSPDGNLLAATGAIMPTVWELPSGTERLSFEGHGSLGFFTRRDVHALAFSPDGKTVATGAADGSIKVWEIAAGSVLKDFNGPGWVSSVVFSPDGKFLAAASATSKEVILWEVATGTELGHITAGSGAGALAFSPDGGLLAAATLSHVEIWRLPLSDQLTQAGQSESIRASGLKNREELVTVFLLPYVAPPWLVRASVAFSPDGSKVAASAAGAVVWDLSASHALFHYYPSQASRHWDHDTVHDVAFSPDGKTAALATGYGVYVFDIPAKPPATGRKNVTEAIAN